MKYQVSYRYRHNNSNSWNHVGHVIVTADSEREVQMILENSNRGSEVEIKSIEEK